MKQAFSVGACVIVPLLVQVVVFHGETIAAWREQKYHEREDHEAFRVLLAAPSEDAKVILESRFPVPRYITCDQHKSEARFVMARLNPRRGSGRAYTRTRVTSLFRPQCDAQLDGLVRWSSDCHR